MWMDDRQQKFTDIEVKKIIYFVARVCPLLRPFYNAILQKRVLWGE